MFYKCCETVLAVWFEKGIAGEYFKRSLCIVRMYELPLHERSISPTISKKNVSNVLSAK